MHTWPSKHLRRVNIALARHICCLKNHLWQFLSQNEINPQKCKADNVFSHMPYIHFPKLTFENVMKREYIYADTQLGIWVNIVQTHWQISSIRGNGKHTQLPVIHSQLWAKYKSKINLHSESSQMHANNSPTQTWRRSHSYSILDISKRVLVCSSSESRKDGSALSQTQPLNRQPMQWTIYFIWFTIISVWKYAYHILSALAFIVCCCWPAPYKHNLFLRMWVLLWLDKICLWMWIQSSELIQSQHFEAYVTKAEMEL